MLFPSLVILLAACAITPTALAAPANIGKRDVCTAAQRIAGAQLITNSFNDQALGGSAAGFANFPVEQNIHAFINPNGAGDVPVAVDKTGFIDFALAARQIFYHVDSVFSDDGSGITVMNANVTLGLRVLALPVTFNAYVNLYYNLEDCLIQKVDVLATIPTIIAGIPIEPPILPQILAIAQITDAV